MQQDQWVKRVAKFQDAKRTNQSQLRREHLIKTSYKQGIMGVDGPDNPSTAKIYQPIRKANEARQKSFSNVMEQRK